MNIPGPRKQPSVSPPGQLQGQPQLRAPHSFAGRGHTPPVNIRQQGPESFDNNTLHYPRYPGAPRFSQSPSNYAGLGSSPHQPQPGPHNPPQPQAPQQQLHVRNVAPAGTLVLDASSIHSYYPSSSGGPQVSTAQQPSSHPQAIQLPTSHLVYSGQAQPNFPAHQNQTRYRNPHPAAQGPQQQQHQQQATAQQQQQQPQPRFHNQGTRFPQPGPGYHPRQASQSAEAQASHSHPSSQAPQPTQILLSQPYPKGTVPHDINKASLGTAVAPRGQTPPQSALASGIMQYNHQNPQQTNHPRHSSQSFMPRASMPQNMGQHPGQHSANAQVYAQYALLPGNQMTQQIPGPQIILNPNNNQLPVQSYQMTPQQQQQVYQPPFYPNNQVFMAPQNHWQSHSQVRVSVAQPTSTQPSPYQKREKKPINIVDPSTGQNVNLDDISASKANGTPPQSSTPNSRGTPVSQQTGPPAPQNASIAAQFATQVAATLSTDKNTPPMQGMPVPQTHVTSSVPQQVPPGAPPHHQNAQMQGGPMTMTPRLNMNPHNQQGMMGPQGMNPRKPPPMLQQQHQDKPKSSPGIQQAPQPLMSQQLTGQPPVMVPGGPGMHPIRVPLAVPPQQQQSQHVQSMPQQPSGPHTAQQQQLQQQQQQQQQSQQQQQQPQQPVSTPQQTPAQEAPVEPQLETRAQAKPEAEESAKEPVDNTVTAAAAPSKPTEAVASQPLDAGKESSPAPEAPVVKQETTSVVTPETTQAVPEGKGNAVESDAKLDKPEPEAAVAAPAQPPAATPAPLNAASTPNPPAPQSAPEPQAPAPTPAPASQANAPDSTPKLPAVESEAEQVKPTSSHQAPVPSQPASAPLPQREEAKDRRKKGMKPRGREINAKQEGSDMDAFTDAKEGTSENTEVSESSSRDGPASAPPQRSSPEQPLSSDQPTKAESSVSEDRTASPAAPQESSTSQEEQRRVAERNEKNSKEHSRVEESPADESPDNNKENHLVEDSKLDKNDTPVIKKDKKELKYKYREDQWSPLNPEGKKHYDRTFLLQLQYSSESMEKPFNLPQLPDVVLETPISSRNEKQFVSTHSGSSMGSLDFTPSYVMQSFHSGKPPLHKSNSRQKSSRGGPGGGGGGGGGGGEPRKVINLSLQEVKLHHTDHAWKPTNKKDSDMNENENLFGKIRSILNKLTPQKFQKLLNQVIELGIDTEDKLAGTIDITFEKAISEPNFSVAYANLCKCLSNLKVPQKNNPEQPIVFRKLLLNRCQKEFEKDKQEALDLAEMQKAIDEAPPEKQKELKEEKYLIEMKARKRSLGNIRFIGELFKLRMLIEKIMHDCLMKLLQAEDEDSLEALCNLLKTVGKDLDEKSKSKVDHYFVQLHKIEQSKKHSSRLRFMILDVIDLRKDNWVPRREDNNPKTIEQIHKEAQQEEQQKKLMLQNMPPDHKNKPRGGRGSQSGGSHSGQQGEDGWTNVKPTRAPSIDPAKMRITKQAPLDESNISLGRPGSFGSWGRGSSGGSKQAAKESERPAAPGNRYSLLSSNSGSGGSDNMDMGRHGVGRGTGVMGGGRDSKSGGRLSQQGWERGKITSRPSQEERESALAAVRSLNNARSTSGSRVSGGSRNSSRDNSRNRSSRDNSRNREKSMDKRPAKAAKELSVDVIEKKSKAFMDEYLQINDLKEALQCIRELESPSNIHMCVNTVLTHVLERSEKARKMASHLLHEAIKEKILTQENFTKGLAEVLEFADDMAIDIPQIWRYLGELIGPLVEDGTWHMSNLRAACKTLVSLNKAGILVSEILHDASHRLGHIKVGEIWKNANMAWHDFLPPSEDLQKFVAKNKLEFTVNQEAPKSPEATTVPIDIVQKGLENLIIEKQADNEEVFDWINANMAEERTREPLFIRALMSTVCSSAIVGQASTCKVEPERIKKRCILLQRYLDHEAQLELQALYALQALVHKLAHPPEVLRVFFDTLYDEDIISEDAFYNWENSSDSAEQAGKGVAVSSVVQFFTWLREAEEDDPEVANK